MFSEPPGPRARLWAAARVCRSAGQRKSRRGGTGGGACAGGQCGGFRDEDAAGGGQERLEGQARGSDTTAGRRGAHAGGTRLALPSPCHGRGQPPAATAPRSRALSLGSGLGPRGLGPAPWGPRPGTRSGSARRRIHSESHVTPRRRRWLSPGPGRGPGTLGRQVERPPGRGVGGKGHRVDRPSTPDARFSNATAVTETPGLAPPGWDGHSGGLTAGRQVPVCGTRVRSTSNSILPPRPLSTRLSTGCSLRASTLCLPARDGGAVREARTQTRTSRTQDRCPPSPAPPRTPLPGWGPPPPSPPARARPSGRPSAGLWARGPWSHVGLTTAARSRRRHSAGAWSLSSRSRA